MAAERPIVIGAPLATAFLYGWDAEKGIKLAAEEINAAGGIAVGNVKRPLKVEVIDTRDLEPGVPVSEALLGLEKLILDKKADVIIGGPIRSEAALAAMDLLNKYKKVSILTTGALTPAYSGRELRQIQILLQDHQPCRGHGGRVHDPPGRSEAKARFQQSLRHGAGCGTRACGRQPDEETSHGKGVGST
jgi:hypothetical protein